MNQPNATQLKPGAVLQAGDFIQRKAAYKHHSPVWEHRNTNPHLISSFTIGRTLLAADLMVASYFRP